MPRLPSTPCTSAPNTNRPNPSRKLKPTRCNREGTLGLLDIPGLFMQSYSFAGFSQVEPESRTFKGGCTNDSKTRGHGCVFPHDFRGLRPKWADFGQSRRGHSVR